MPGKTKHEKDRKVIDKTLRSSGIPALIFAASANGLFIRAWLVITVPLLMSCRPTDLLGTYLAKIACSLQAVIKVAADFVLYRRSRFRSAYLNLLLLPSQHLSVAPVVCAQLARNWLSISLREARPKTNHLLERMR